MAAGGSAQFAASARWSTGHRLTVKEEPLPRQLWLPSTIHPSDLCGGAGHYSVLMVALPETFAYRSPMSQCGAAEKPYPTVLPDPQIMRGPGFVGWGVTESRGHRSLNWRIGATAKGHLYITAEQLAGAVQLGLHQGRLLVDLTGDFARPRIPPERELSIAECWFTPPTVGGWYSAATIMVPGIVESINEDLPLERPSTQSWPAPSWPQHVYAQVLVGHAEQKPPSLADTVGLIGQITLGSGRAVRVFAAVRSRESGLDHFLEAHHNSSLTTRATKFAWGHTDDVPYLIDLAGV